MAVFLAVAVVVAAVVTGGCGYWRCGDGALGGGSGGGGGGGGDGGVDGGWW